MSKGFYNRYSTTPITKVSDFVQCSEAHKNIRRYQNEDAWVFTAKDYNGREYTFTLEIRDSAEDKIVHIAMCTGLYVKDDPAIAAELLRSNARILDNKANPAIACISEEDGEIEIRKSIDLDKHSDCELYDAELDCFGYWGALERRLQRFLSGKAEAVVGDLSGEEAAGEFDDGEDVVSVNDINNNIQGRASAAENDIVKETFKKFLVE